MFRCKSILLGVLGFGAFGLVFGWGRPVAGAEAANPVPLTRAHAHNDYLHARPLLDALDHGFCSVEADIWLLDGVLLVAHDREAVDPARTLESLYLAPLQERVKSNGGRVFPGGPSFTLLIDIKSEAESTYLALQAELVKYADMMTRFYPDRTETNAVTAVVSGNRPREMMERQASRLMGYDGRIEDLRQEVSPHFMPLVSDNWDRWFRWRGEGTPSEEDRKRLEQLVRVAHHYKVRLRLWAAPDHKDSWKFQYLAGVDRINTDNLNGLRDFLLLARKYERAQEIKSRMTFPPFPKSGEANTP